MSVEERARELNFLAEKIRGSFTNFNSQFKKISNKRKSIRKRILEGKERNVKMKSSSSTFGKTIKNVSSKSAPNSRSLFGGINIGAFLFALPLIGKVLGFTALALFGVTVANLFKVNKKLDDESKVMREKSDNVGNTFVKLADGLKGFIGGLGTMEKKFDSTFDDVDSNIKKAETEMSQLKGESSKLDNFNLSNILTNSSGADDDDEREVDDGVDPRFKKPSASSLDSAKSNTNVRKNASESAEEFRKKDVALVKTNTMFNKEETKEINFHKDLLARLSDQNLNIEDINLRSLSLSESEDGDTIIIKVNEKTIVKE